MYIAILVLIGEAAPAELDGWPRLAIQLDLVLILASLVVREDHFAQPILSSPPMARLGVISYGIYLYHPWIIWLTAIAVGRIGFTSVPPHIMFLLSTSATIITAETSFRLIEQPLQHIKERYSS